jgi:hypothetical protein
VVAGLTLTFADGDIELQGPTDAPELDVLAAGAPHERFCWIYSHLVQG